MPVSSFLHDFFLCFFFLLLELDDEEVDDDVVDDDVLASPPFLPAFSVGLSQMVTLQVFGVVDEEAPECFLFVPGVFFWSRCVLI